MIIAVAWRNIWRNKTRSLVILIAVCLGLTSGIFYIGFYNGMVDQRIDAAIKTEASHIQIHHSGFLANPDKKLIIPLADSVAGVIRQTDGVKATSNRIILNTMIQSPVTGSGVKVTGILPDDEKKVTNVASKLIEGSWFEATKRNPVVIGKKLADKLKAELKSKVVITMQDMEGNMTAGAFRIEGIFETSNSTYDENNVFVRSSDLSAILGIQAGECHEIAVLLYRNSSLDAAAAILKGKLPDLDVKTWRETMPEVSLVESSFDITMFIIMLVILLALLFGIINTMLMAVLERTKELGMLMAIGMNKARVFMMILAETVLLSLTGGLCGILLGWALIGWFGHAGIDLGAWSAAYKSMGYDTLVYTRLSLSVSLRIALMVIGTGVAASVYPALKALRLRPAEAIRIDM
jgi:ABC-type lipoprotein release transport system permease subunit